MEASPISVFARRYIVGYMKFIKIYIDFSKEILMVKGLFGLKEGRG